MKTIGIDVGGTFTDIILSSREEGINSVHKVPSTPECQEKAVIRGISEILEMAGVSGYEIGLIAHGTTVATNAMLQRKGARVLLVTTRGLEDVIEIGRQAREEIYDLSAKRAVPLVPPDMRIGVNERLDYEGQTIIPLTSEEVDRIQLEARRVNPDSIAISLLFSYKNPNHERHLRDNLQRAGFSYVVASSEVLPEFREFERTSTTVLEAYLGPLVLGYLEKLDDAVQALCPNAKLTVMQSNGGTLLCSEAKGKAVGLAISGLAGGVIGGWDIARTAGVDKVITLDMGGTSCDVSAIDGQIIVHPDNDVGGLPIRAPSVDVKTIGAGGGSITWIDSAGILHVGPKSAGANPGPAAYDMGGTDATVTDANLIIGRLNPYYFLGGAVNLDIKKAVAAIEPLADRLGLSVEETALGIIRISSANMVQAIREITIERGHDPRNFILIPFGGAGPTQAVDICESLGIRQIIVPPYPGITSAYGLACADLRVDLMKSVLVSQEQHDLDVIEETLLDLTGDAEVRLAEQGVDTESIIYAWQLDMRYLGQSHELQIDVPFNDSDVVAVSANQFKDKHYGAFGYNLEDRGIEWVTARVIARSPTGAMPTYIYEPKSTGIPPAKRRIITRDGNETDADVFRRDQLAVLCSITGPAIIEQVDSTTYVGIGWTAEQMHTGNLILRREGLD